MLFNSITKHLRVTFIVKNLVALLILLWFGAMAVSGQATTEQTAPLQTATEEAKTVLTPVMQDYKGIKIGMSAEEVEDKLGKPKADDETGLFYAFSDDESVQIALDTDKTVRVISVIYSEDEKAPKYEDVFGKQIKLNSQPDGSIYNQARYPEAGYLVIYSRSTGDNPMVIVTMQEMPQTAKAKIASATGTN